MAERVSIVESIIAGDMLFCDARRPGKIDLQHTAFQEAMRAVAKNLANLDSNADRHLGRVLFMFDQVGSWRNHIAEGTSRKGARSPHLTDLSPNFVFSLQGVARQFGVDPSIIEAVPEEKLRAVIKDCLHESEADSERLARWRGLGVYELQDRREEILQACDEECSIDEDAGGRSENESSSAQKEVVLCRGIASALFRRASTTRPTPDRQVDVVKAFFAADPQVSNRVRLPIILDGAVFAQTELDVKSEIRVYFYTPISTLGAAAAPEQIWIMRGGATTEIK
ncbi:MAG: hypothetical protein WC924_02565 [Candidatus Gracilibacteria bacterium]